ncbi:MAG: hypothetical protein OEZ45_02060 [Candidatus Aminicenantes bacterium]|nr:hypothetical protein [Candidatus Aminicenantes bacterium]
MQGDLSRFLPGSGEVQGWERDGAPQAYRGEGLYEYINGGAEIYHEYGFRQVVVQDFKRKDGKSISVEIFEMEDPESAYGIFTFKTNPEDREISLGSDALLSDYYLNFWKARYLVTLTGFDEDEETIRGLQNIAHSIDTKIKADGNRPSLVSALPEEGLERASLKYFEGNLGLHNSYPFFTEDVFRLKEGIKGDYKGGYSLYIIESRTAEKGPVDFDDLKKSFKASSRYSHFRSLEELIFRVEDRKGKQVYVTQSKDKTLIVIGTVSQERIKNIFAGIQEIK